MQLALKKCVLTSVKPVQPGIGHTHARIPVLFMKCYSGFGLWRRVRAGTGSLAAGFTSTSTCLTTCYIPLRADRCTFRDWLVGTGKTQRARSQERMRWETLHAINTGESVRRTNYSCTHIRILYTVIDASGGALRSCMASCSLCKKQSSSPIHADFENAREMCGNPIMLQKA